MTLAFRLLFSFSVLSFTSCGGQDYAIKDAYLQTINATDIKHLIIECYCQNGVEIVESTDQEIYLNILGKLESVGYHGKQEKPDHISRETLSFKIEKDKSTLKLISKERTFIHHSFLIEELEIKIPKGISYEIVKVKGEDLEGRNID